jgi:hypothetical protein
VKFVFWCDAQAGHSRRGGGQMCREQEEVKARAVDSHMPDADANRKRIKSVNVATSNLF